jgi:hypothetical protein
MDVVAAVAVGREWTAGPMPARRVSWMPGAEGAPRDFWLWELGWELGGAIRIACDVYENRFKVLEAVMKYIEDFS